MIENLILWDIENVFNSENTALNIGKTLIERYTKRNSEFYIIHSGRFDRNIGLKQQQSLEQSDQSNQSSQTRDS